jgi:hypothetical protein
MPELHLSILPPPQRTLWDVLVSQADGLRDGDYYLAGGTGLALQLGHRQSVDFDFFSQQPGLVEGTEAWLQQIPGYLTRDLERDTLHAEVAGVKLSFIGAYKYPLVAPTVDAGGIRIAAPLDIGLMKLLAITHRATPRDYLDLAALLRSGWSLPALLGASTRKYGVGFNPMVSLRALTAFDDLEGELPTVLDETLASTWKETLRQAVRGVADQ